MDVDLPALADGRVRIRSRDQEAFADSRSVRARRGLVALAQGRLRPNRFKGVRPPTPPVQGWIGDRLRSAGGARYFSRSASVGMRPFGVR
jgi:hypothetical protein